MLKWFFKSQEQKQKPIYSYNIYEQYTTIDQQSKQIKRQTINYGPLNKNNKFQGWERVKIKAKNYRQIKNNLKDQLTHFQDPDFPHSNQSIGNHYNDNKVIWKRVGDIVNNTVFINQHSFDSLQKIQCSNKPLQNAISIMARVQPKKCAQILSKEYNDQGIYQFKFMKNGIIESVLIDDYVPTYMNMPLFVGPVFDRQVFGMLIEKAIAKCFGSYQNMPGTAEQLIEVMMCVASRRRQIKNIKIQETVTDALKSKCLVLFQSKNDNKVRNYGINQNELYQLVQCHRNINVRENGLINLYEVVSENKMSAWNGRYSLNDEKWKDISPHDSTTILKQIMKNRSFVVCQQDIPRIFDQILIFEDSLSFNKDWVENISRDSSPSFVSFQLYNDDRVFIRVKTPTETHHSIILTNIVKIDDVYQKHFVCGDNKINSKKSQIHKELKAGKYLLCVFHDCQSQNTLDYSVFLSSFVHTNLQVVSNSSYPYFLQELFNNYWNTQKNQIQSQFHGENKLYSVMILSQQCGFAFLKIHTANIQKQFIKLLINQNKVYEQKWSILEPYAKRNEVIITKNQNKGSVIIIFRANQDTQAGHYYFPITAFKIIE